MAGATVGDLAVRVGGDVSGFESDMASAARTVRNFSNDAVRDLRKVVDSTVKMGLAAAVAGATGMLVLAKDTAAASKEIKLLSNVANTATDQFQAMAYGASKFDIEMDKVSDILKDVNDRVGDFLSTGGGPMADFFENIAPKVGVTANMFRDLSGADALQLYISSLEKANVSQAEMVFYMEAMASDLTNLQPLLANDGKLLAEMTKEARDLGISLTDIELAQLEELNKHMAMTSKVMEGIGNKISVAVTPYIVEAMDRFKDLSASSDGFGMSVEGAVKRAIHFAGQFADVLRGLHVVFKGVELVAVGFGAAVVSVMEGAMTGIAEFTDVAIASVNSVIAGLNKIPKVEIELINSAANSEFMENLHAAGNHARDSVVRVRDELNNLAMAEMPSSRVEEFLEAVKERSVVAATEVADSVANITGGAMGGEGETQEDIYLKKENALKDHLKAMYDIEADAARGIEGITKDKYGVVASTTFGAMRDMVSTVSNGSKKAFEVSKKFAIADALISTYQGIAAGVKLGWPQAIPAVAWAAATGFKQISAIKSQTFGGSSSGSSSATTSAASSDSSSSSSSSSSGGNSGTLTVAPIDPNAIFSGASMQAFGEKLYDYSKDGGKVVFAA